MLDRVANDHEIVIVRRKGDEKVAMVPADELRRAYRDSPPFAISQECAAVDDRFAAGHQIEKAGRNPLDKLRRELGLASQR